ncbi:MAG: IS21 family transposase [Betaproteobacteria bacterium]|nr:IS21 family transposase [Betaproteobacteria bacterium]
MNVLRPHLRITVATLLRGGASQREIERITGVDRKTIRRMKRQANSPGVATGSAGPVGQIPPPWPPADTDGVAVTRSAASTSACEAHRSWIEAQVQLGRNAVSIFQDLVEAHGFAHRYNAVKRFVARLRARVPERFDVLEFLPREESQVDYGQGAMTLYKPGKYKRLYLFVMTLKYSGKSFRKTVWKTSQEIWARLHEEAWRAFGGCCQYVVLDNLKEGVIRPDIYAPELNPVYAAMLAHYGVVADPARVRDPNRKGTVESAIQHTQATALKGRRFDSIEAQNTWLAHWEERWAALRIHGRKKRQVLEMFHEEQPHLRALPLEGFRYFKQGVRTVDDAALVQIDSSYYAALPAVPHSEVTVRVYERDIEILDAAGMCPDRTKGQSDLIRCSAYFFDHLGEALDIVREYLNELLLGCHGWRKFHFIEQTRDFGTA